MQYYVIRSPSRMEEKALKLARRVMARHGVRLILPKRRLWIRRQGRRLMEERPIFPSYLFLETEQLTPDLYHAIKKETPILRFLRLSDSFSQLSESDLEVLRSFIRHGETVGPSLVRFDENQRIRVIQGPLAGFEGNIIKVDRRKGRARVMFDFQHQSFQIDLGFETLEGGTR